MSTYANAVSGGAVRDVGEGQLEDALVTHLDCVGVACHPAGMGTMGGGEDQPAVEADPGLELIVAADQVFVNVPGNEGRMLQLGYDASFRSYFAVIFVG